MGCGSGRWTMVHGSAPEPPWVDTQPNQIKALTAIRWETDSGLPTFQCMTQDIQINENITECRGFTFYRHCSECFKMPTHFNLKAILGGHCRCSHRK